MRKATVFSAITLAIAGVALYVWTTDGSPTSETNDRLVDTNSGPIETDTALVGGPSAPTTNSDLSSMPITVPKARVDNDVAARETKKRNLCDDREPPDMSESIGQQIKFRNFCDRFGFANQLGELAHRQGKDPEWGAESETILRSMLIENFEDDPPPFNLECFDTICSFDTSANTRELLIISRVFTQFMNSSDSLVNHYFIQKLADGYHVGFLFRDTFSLSELNEL